MWDTSKIDSGSFTIQQYINDHQLASKSNIHLFADDTNLTSSNTNPKLLEKIVNEELQKICHWMHLNTLSINFAKTRIHNNNIKQKIDQPFKLTIEGNQTIQKNSIKYLGVVIDENISWKQQVKEKCSKISKGSWAMYRMKTYVDYNTLRSVYFAIIYPHLQYCISSGWNASHLALQLIMTLQKCCIRILTGGRCPKVHTYGPVVLTVAQFVQNHLHS